MPPTFIRSMAIRGQCRNVLLHKMASSCRWRAIGDTCSNHQCCTKRGTLLKGCRPPTNRCRGRRSLHQTLATNTIVIAPGQTTNFLLSADKNVGQYPIAVDNQTATATVQYTGTLSTSAMTSTNPPPQNATPVASTFTDSLRSLNSKPFPAKVPLTVNHSLLFTAGLGINPCSSCINGSRVVAAVNNVSFVMPTTALLQTHYFHTSEVFTTDFPGNPPNAFNYSSSGPKNIQTMNGTRLYRLAYNSTVQVVLQDKGIIAPENHPIHLHGFNFFTIRI